jgi:hypothetical protein
MKELAFSQVKGHKTSGVAYGCGVRSTCFFACRELCGGISVSIVTLVDGGLGCRVGWLPLTGGSRSGSMPRVVSIVEALVW